MSSSPLVVVTYRAPSGPIRAALLVPADVHLVVRAVEAVGWDCVGVGQCMYSINMEFVRAD